MITLPEFVLARNAEREAVALRICPGRNAANGHWRANSLEFDGAHDKETTRHIVLNDPTHVLAWCETVRQIVDEHAVRELASLDHASWGKSVLACRRCCIGERQVVAPCPTLRLLALPDANHPDYDPAWAIRATPPSPPG